MPTTPLYHQVRPTPQRCFHRQVGPVIPQRYPHYCHHTSRRLLLLHSRQIYPPSIQHMCQHQHRQKLQQHYQHPDHLTFRRHCLLPSQHLSRILLLRQLSCLQIFPTFSLPVVSRLGHHSLLLKCIPYSRRWPTPSPSTSRWFCRETTTWA